MKNRQSCKDTIRVTCMNLEDKLDEQVRFLSGGQQQALGIILACDMPSPILLMDEPTASLDIFVAEKILKMAIHEVQERNGVLIFTSHNLFDILRYTESVIVMGKGNNMTCLLNQEGVDVGLLRDIMQR